MMKHLKIRASKSSENVTQFRCLGTTLTGEKYIL